MSTRHYKDKNYSGTSRLIVLGDQFDFWGNSLNNELSSHKWVSW